LFGTRIYSCLPQDQTIGRESQVDHPPHPPPHPTLPSEFFFSLVAANEKIYSSPGKQHLERHNEIVSKSFDLNGIDLSTSTSAPPSPAPTIPPPSATATAAAASPFVTPTKKNENGFLINIPRSAVKLPLETEQNHHSSSLTTEFSSVIPINPENILQELIHSKLLLASVATELQEEKHLVNVLSKANQRYAEKVSSSSPSHTHTHHCTPPTLHSLLPPP
jgi:hypothetical protein